MPLQMHELGKAGSQTYQYVQVVCKDLRCVRGPVGGKSRGAQLVHPRAT